MGAKWWGLRRRFSFKKEIHLLCRICKEFVEEGRGCVRGIRWENGR